jgi:hypothetical protein
VTLEIGLEVKRLEGGGDLADESKGRLKGNTEGYTGRRE